MAAPKPPPKKWQAVVRLSEETLAEVDALAAAEGRTRSDMIRVLLAEAIGARHRGRRR